MARLAEKNMHGDRGRGEMYTTTAVRRKFQGWQDCSGGGGIGDSEDLVERQR